MQILRTAAAASVGGVQRTIRPLIILGEIEIERRGTEGALMSRVNGQTNRWLPDCQYTQRKCVHSWINGGANCNNLGHCWLYGWLDREGELANSLNVP